MTGDLANTDWAGGSGRRRGGWVRARLVLVGLLLAGLATVLLSFPLLPFTSPALNEGDVASRDVRSPRRMTYESAIRTAEQQELAVEVVEPVYTTPDADLARQQHERARQVLDFLGSVRADDLATEAQRRAWMQAVPELRDLPAGVAGDILALSEESWGRVQLDTLNVVAETMRRGVREGFVAEARQEVPTLVGLDLSVEEAAVTAAMAQRLVVANSFFDEAATQTARDQAREDVSPVLRTVAVNEVIVREGQRVTALDLEALQALGLQQSRTNWTYVVGHASLVVTGLVLMGLFLARFRPDVLLDGRQLLLLALLLAVFVFLARLMVPEQAVLRYLYPAPALAMLATATVGPPLGVAVSVLIGFAVGVVAGGSFEMAVYAATGGVVAALTAQRADRPAALFRSALLVACAEVAVLAGIRLPDQHLDLMETGLQLATAAANGLLSASVALGGLFLFGPLFDVITTFRLIELSRPDHPLLQRLLREAPGTYHHSLMVANLAEQAAERIGVDPLLTRVGAYYHDVGKVARPYFFSENQLEGVNPHERLDPYTSVEIIMGHVQDGLELARRYRIPERVRAFIPEHHGTSAASFQYERARDLADDPELVDEAGFHHRGPKPQSRETALVMLADRCEATVRARRPATPEELARVVGEVFDCVLDGGQLDECPITLRELRVVRSSFISTLKGIFHPRVQYPQVPGVAARPAGAHLPSGGRRAAPGDPQE